MWAIQSVSAPPQTVWNMKHGQAVITKAEQRDDRLATKGVIGQSATVQLCSQSAPQQDPCLHKDPWQNAVRPQVAQPAQPVKLQDMEERIEKAILAKLPKESMDVDTQEGLFRWSNRCNR